VQRLICAVALALFAISCAHEPPAFCVDASFTTEQRADIADGAAQWNAVATERITLDGEDWRIVLGDTPVGETGFTDREHRTVVVRRDLSAKIFRRVVVHELGHVLGLEHLGEHEKGVMTWNVGDDNRATDTLTRADVAECRRVGACS
jgi:hypothetical protein